MGTRGGPALLVLQQAPLDSEKNGIEGAWLGPLCCLFNSCVIKYWFLPLCIIRCRLLITSTCRPLFELPRGSKAHPIQPHTPSSFHSSDVSVHSISFRLLHSVAYSNVGAGKDSKRVTVPSSPHSVRLPLQAIGPRALHALHTLLLSNCLHLRSFRATHYVILNVIICVIQMKLGTCQFTIIRFVKRIQNDVQDDAVMRDVKFKFNFQ